MGTTRRKPPSRIRYEESHPVVSCRIPKADYDLLKQRLDERGISFATFVKEALGCLEAKLTPIDQARAEGYEQGYKQATEDHQIWYHCKICQGRINIFPNSESHKAIIQYMNEKGWSHTKCHEKEKEKKPLYKNPVTIFPYYPHYPYYPYYPRYPYY